MVVSVWLLGSGIESLRKKSERKKAARRPPWVGVEREGLRRRQVEHATRRFLVARDQRILGEDLPSVGVAGFRQRQRDHLPAVEIGHRPLVHFQNQHVAGPLETVGYHLECS